MCGWGQVASSTPAWATAAWQRPAVEPALIDARKKGVAAVRSSRVGSGASSSRRNEPGGEGRRPPISVVSDTLNPQKARILLMLSAERGRTTRRRSSGCSTRTDRWRRGWYAPAVQPGVPCKSSTEHHFGPAAMLDYLCARRTIRIAHCRPARRLSSSFPAAGALTTDLPLDESLHHRRTFSGRSLVLPSCCKTDVGEIPGGPASPATLPRQPEELRHAAGTITILSTQE